jgi:starch-binding outer membrane protein, SusD/RagB family
MRRIIIFALVIVSLAGVSCKKYLDAESPSVFTQADIFDNVNDATKAVNGIYAMFNQDAFTSRVSNNFTGNTDMEVGSVGASPDGSRRDIWSFEANPSNSDLLTVWNNAYTAINRANDCIEGIDKSPIASDKMMKQLKGEALTLRAYWYYLLMNHWGDVPFKTTSTQSTDNFYLPKTGRDTILTSLINDLKGIEESMLWADQLDYGIERVNREFTLGMIAKLALMRGGYWLYPDLTMQRKADYLDYYQIANTYTKKLITLKPRTLPDYATVFQNINKYIKPVNSDVLYEVAFAPGFGDVGWSVGVAVTAGNHPYGATTIQMNLTPNYYHSFDTTDLRLPVTCAIVSYNDTLGQVPVAVTSIGINKWNRLLVPTPLGSASTKGTGINWPLMRYADVLLMYAESENELNGPGGEAQNALTLIRRRAFPSSLWSTQVDAYVAAAAASKASFFNAIVNERAWEFGGEFLRKYDLERWNLYGKKIAEARNLLTQMGQDAISGTGPTSYLADYLYYKRDSSNKKLITFLNRYYRPSTPPPVVNVPNQGDNPTGYLRATWLRGLWNTTTNAPADYILREWRGYTDNTGNSPVRYILPIHNSIISSSQGALKNEYGY